MGDTIAVFPIFSKKGNEEAISQMNPRGTKAMWINPSNLSSGTYGLSLDSAATVYTATRV